MKFLSGFSCEERCYLYESIGKKLRGGFDIGVNIEDLKSQRRVE